jgi:hypothetical protein
MSNQTPTPETDAFALSETRTDHGWRTLARRLERERDEARADADILRAERNAEATEVRRLQMELDASCNAEELRQVRVEKERWRGAAELLRAALVEFGITPAERLGIAAYNKAKEEAK